ncbi:protein distal antenna-related [Drosophila busckii]|uniref:protein distal antenna-related n=1 Tax=Drosophila busckii TaxID=30019 RepID=UPI00083EC359|nr:protein distal antenna-related [Drosophila busckii]
MERNAVPRGKRPRVQVSMDDKERAIQRIRNGETKAGISRELGVPESTVRGWVKRADQRIAREAAKESSTELATAVEVAAPLPPPQLPVQLPSKRDHNGQSVVLLPSCPVPAQVPLPLPMQLFQQAADSDLQLNGWLHIFNAGILNFTLIATAAYLRACVRGNTDQQSLWQIICEYVDEAGRNVAANGGRYVAAALSSPAPATRNGGGGFVAPRLHITAEDDEDEHDAQQQQQQQQQGQGELPQRAA